MYDIRRDRQGRIHPLASIWWSTPDGTRVATAGTQPAIDAAAASIDRLRDDVSDAFLIVSTVAISDQLEATEESQRGFATLQKTVALLSAFLLVPTLIAAIFSAQIALPGSDAEARTKIMFGLIAVGAAATYIIVSRFGRNL